ncbi:MAG: hypothetical protein CME64_12805 [Halobacteriovoraceae bacterium]|nr:hypothetical protein [Halobacteriovoraceae bacterium]|tara:strand:- start:130839 stop:132944 length:2106 start_codon:yes stop_codon:yes gene_type:complete
MKFNLSLKQKLLLSNIGLIVVFGLILLFQFNNALSQQKVEIRNGFNNSSSKLSGNLSQNFYKFYHNVQAISKNESLKGEDKQKISFFLNELVSLYPNYDFMVLTDLEGNYKSSSFLSPTGDKLAVSNLEGKNFSGTEWFKATKDGDLTEDYEKKIYGSHFSEIKDSEIGKLLYGESKKGFYVTTPVQDEFGDSLAILTTFVGVRAINESVAELEASLKEEGKEGALIRVMGANKLISSNQESEKTLTPRSSLKFEEDDDKKNEGFELPWAKSRPLVAVEKINDKRFLKELDWEVYVEMDSTEAFQGINASKNFFGVSFIISLILSAIVAFFMSRALSNRMSKAAESVSSGSDEINEASGEISDQAKLLSESTNQQASSLHETVSSLNEISAMVSKSASHSQSSKEMSSRSRESANEGMKTVEQMLEAIDEIASANSEIVEQLNTNSKEMQEITNVIKEIEDKTKVINDIVFQTKLLSFNASVEAARAGEHGKGFAVVAEEVGTLAKSSGDAATEIEDMLAKSIESVNKIVENTKNRVDGLVEKGSAKVEMGREVSKQCKDALEIILDQSSNLDMAIEEIATASVEQSQGIQEISKAMDQLNAVTSQNSDIAKKVSNGTDQLNQQAEKLSFVSMNLNKMVYGKEKINEPVKSDSSSNEDDNKVIKFEQKKSQQEPPKPVEEKVTVNGSETALDSDDHEWEDL